MDLIWLESLLALVEQGNFTMAARSQHISQSAFSRRIRALEMWAGAELVDRSTYPAALTLAGAKVQAMAVDAVSELQQLRDDINKYRAKPDGAVTLSTSHILATHYFVKWWRLINGPSQHVPCILKTLNTLDAYDSLMQHDSDLLLAYADPAMPIHVDQSQLEWRVLAKDTLAPYSRMIDGCAEFRLPGSAEMPTPFITYGSSAFLGRVTGRILEGRRGFLHPVAQTDLSSAMDKLVRAGVGVAWLPGILDSPETFGDKVTLVGDGDWSSELEIRLYRQRQKNLSPHAELIWERACALPEAT